MALVPEVAHYEMPQRRLRCISFDAKVEPDCVLLAVQNLGRSERSMHGAVMDAIGVDFGPGDGGLERHLLWREREAITPGWNGFEECIAIPPHEQRHLVLPLPQNRYVVRVRVWDFRDDGAPWATNLVAISGSRIDRGVTSAGATAWLVDEPLPIWAHWSISSRDGVGLRQ